MIEFEAQLTVGIEGLAVTEIQAELRQGTKPFSDPNFTPRDAILSDIRDACIEDWYELNIAPKIDEADPIGEFTVKGSAWWYGGPEDQELEYLGVIVSKQ